MKDKSVKLANYLCGKIDDSDICCLSECIGARQPEHSLNGICKNDNVNLWDNDTIDCGGGGGDDDDDDDGKGGEDSDDNDQTAASSSATGAHASEPTVTPSTSSNTAVQTTFPTQTATSSPAGSSSPSPSPSSTSIPTSTSTSTSTSSAGSSIRAANIIAVGFLTVILIAGIGGGAV